MFSESLCTRSAKLEEKTRLRSRLAAAIVAFEKNGHGRRMGEARRGEARRGRERDRDRERRADRLFEEKAGDQESRRIGARNGA